MAKIEVPEIIMVDLKHHDEELSVNLSDKSPEWLAWAVAFALRQSAGDADAGLKDESLATRKAAVRAKFNRIAAGEIPAGGGGGGRKADYESQAELDVLRQLYQAEFGLNATEAAKRVPAKKRLAAWQELTRRGLIAAMNSQGVDPQSVDNWQELVETNLPAMKAMYKDDIAEKAESLRKAAEAPKGLAEKAKMLKF